MARDRPAWRSQGLRGTGKGCVQGKTLRRGITGSKSPCPCPVPGKEKEAEVTGLQQQGQLESSCSMLLAEEGGKPPFSEQQAAGGRGDPVVMEEAGKNHKGSR